MKIIFKCPNCGRKNEYELSKYEDNVWLGYDLGKCMEDVTKVYIAAICKFCNEEVTYEEDA